MPTSAEGREITIASEDGEFKAYVATPASGHGPGVVVLQEWWGLVPQIRDVCDRLARSGFVAPGCETSILTRSCFGPG